MKDGQARELSEDFIDPLLKVKALRDIKLIEYYAAKMAAPQHLISPSIQMSEKERAKTDIYMVLTKAQRKKMAIVRQSNKKALH